MVIVEINEPSPLCTGRGESLSWDSSPPFKQQPMVASEDKFRIHDNTLRRRNRQPANHLHDDSVYDVTTELRSSECLAERKPVVQQVAAFSRPAHCTAPAPRRPTHQKYTSARRKGIIPWTKEKKKRNPKATLVDKKANKKLIKIASCSKS